MELKKGDVIHCYDKDEAVEIDQALTQEGYITDFDYTNGVAIVIEGKRKCTQ